MSENFGRGLARTLWEQGETVAAMQVDLPLVLHCQERWFWLERNMVLFQGVLSCWFVQCGNSGLPDLESRLSQILCVLSNKAFLFIFI